MPGEQQRWSELSRGELGHRYLNEIEPEWRGDRPDTDRQYPRVRWLVENGYSGLRYALREHHDMTVQEFLEDVSGASRDRPGSPQGSDGENGAGGVSIADESTRTALAAYFERREEHELLESSTLASKRSRLTTYLEIYEEVHGTDAIVPAAADAGDEPAEIQRCLRVLDRLEEHLGTDDSRLTYLADVRSIYTWLEEHGYIASNPLNGIQSELSWTRSEPDNPALEAGQVRELYGAAAGPGEQLLVVGLAGWGLRPSELAALHVRQLVLEGDDAHIAFDEQRKNGPGTVAMLYGQAAVDDRIDELADQDDWTGYLFPSTSSESGHVHPDTIRARFRSLADRADVQVAGETPTPKMGRRFWYSTYVEASAAVIEQLEFVAEEQGSSSATVVQESYLSEERRRRLRRRLMRNDLQEAFGDA